MIKKIYGENSTYEIKNNQTSELLKKYKDNFLDETEKIELLERVVLMTPIQIHINSFMYEPLIDMGYSELTALYTKVKNKLNTNVKDNKLKKPHVTKNTVNITETATSDSF